MSTTTGPCSLVGAVPRLAICMTGVTVSPGTRGDGTRNSVTWRFGSGAVRVMAWCDLKALLAKPDSRIASSPLTT